jgi:UDP:flavonoid glycosyltransferase YjiC (YdhE family)
MSDFLFVTWDGGGNVPPATALAGALVRRGHSIRVLGHASQEDAITSTGLRFVRPTHARSFSTYSPLTMMSVFADRGLGRDLLAAVAAEPADLVVIDSLMFGAMDAARRAGLRYVVLEHMYDASYRRGILGGPMGLNLRLRRLAPRRALDEAALRLVATLPDLDPVDGPNVRQVGPVAPWSERTPGSGEPPVVLSLSTFPYPGMAETLQKLVDATEGVADRVLVSTGPAVDPADLRTRPGVEVHRWLPHAEVLPRAALLVTHGGHGSAMTGLAHDLPLLVVPMDKLTDQPVVGRSVEAAGAGRMLARSASVDEIRSALATLVADGPHRAAAARLGAAVRATDAVRDGCAALEELLRDGATAPGPRAARP